MDGTPARRVLIDRSVSEPLPIDDVMSSSLRALTESFALGRTGTLNSLHSHPISHALSLTHITSKHGGSLYAEEDALLGPRGSATKIKAIYNILCAMIGAGVLGLPSVMAGCSWEGVVLIVVAGLALKFSGQCMTDCFLEDPELVTYRDLGDKAFGTFGQIFVLVIQMTNCVGSAVAFLILASQNMAGLIERTTWIDAKFADWQLTLLATTIALPFALFRNLDDIGIASLLGLMASFITLGCIVITMLTNYLPMYNDTKPVYSDPQLLPYFSGAATCAFAFGGHVVFPSIIQVMENPQEFKPALDFSFYFLIVLYSTFAAFCYWCFGADTQDNILKNIGPGWAYTVSVLMVTSHVIFAVAVFMNPIFYLLEVSVGVESINTNKQTPQQLMGRVLLRPLILLILCGFAIMIPNFGQVLNLVGGSVILCSIFTCPLAIYLKLHWNRMSVKRGIIIGMMVVGVIVGAVSTVITIIDFINGEGKSPH